MKDKWFDYFSIKRSGLFDTHFYLLTYKDVRRADVNPLIHFVKSGWKEGRNPSQFFDTNYYLETNPDVEQSGINPLVHYSRWGKREGRSPLPSSSESQYPELLLKSEKIAPGSLINPGLTRQEFADIGSASLNTNSDGWLDQDVLEIITNLSQ